MFNVFLRLLKGLFRQLTYLRSHWMDFKKEMSSQTIISIISTNLALRCSIITYGLSCSIIWSSKNRIVFLEIRELQNLLSLTACSNPRIHNIFTFSVPSLQIVRVAGQVVNIECSRQINSTAKDNTNGLSVDKYKNNQLFVWFDSSLCHILFSDIFCS